jgi:hypothetical protein
MDVLSAVLIGLIGCLLLTQAVILWSYPAYLEASKSGRRIELFGFLAALVVAVTALAAFIWQTAQSDRLAAIESRLDRLEAGSRR